jgi:hypothetical protein
MSIDLLRVVLSPTSARHVHPSIQQNKQAIVPISSHPKITPLKKYNILPPRLAKISSIEEALYSVYSMNGACQAPELADTVAGLGMLSVWGNLATKVEWLDLALNELEGRCSYNESCFLFAYCGK